MLAEIQKSKATGEAVPETVEQLAERKQREHDLERKHGINLTSDVEAKKLWEKEQLEKVDKLNDQMKTMPDLPPETKALVAKQLSESGDKGQELAALERATKGPNGERA